MARGGKQKRPSKKEHCPTPHKRGCKLSFVGCLFLESVPILSIWQVFWLALLGPVFPCDYGAAQ